RSVGEGRALTHKLAVQPKTETLPLLAHVERLAGLEALARQTRGFAIGERAGEQQLLASGIQQAETEAAVVIAEADETCALDGFLLAGIAALSLTAERAKADRFAQLAEEWRGHTACLAGTLLEDVLKVRRLVDQRLVAF